MSLSPQLLAILVCPKCKGELEYREADSALDCHTCKLRYQIRDGIPIMLAGNANGKLKTGMHIAGNSETTSRVGLTVQQAMGMAVDAWGAESNRTNKPISEILA